jgi:hypothetical protein
MTPSRRTWLVFGAGSAVLLGGIIGLSLFWWWLWRHPPGIRPVAGSRRVRTAAAAVALAVVAVGTIWRLVIAIEPTPACSPPGGTQASSRSGPADAWLLTQQAATWPETGIGVLYSRVSGARICLSRSADYYVALHSDNIAGDRAMTLGDIVLTPGFDLPRDELTALAGHEARHRAQWAVGTIVGGPLAFPVAYAVDDFFFPGARNQFERQAGLESGLYSHRNAGPVLGPAQFAVLGVVAAIIIAVPVAVRRRRAKARSSGQTAHTAGTEFRTTDELAEDK